MAAGAASAPARSSSACGDRGRELVANGGEGLFDGGTRSRLGVAAGAEHFELGVNGFAFGDGWASSSRRVASASSAAATAAVCGRCAGTKLLGSSGRSGELVANRGKGLFDGGTRCRLGVAAGAEHLELCVDGLAFGDCVCKLVAKRCESLLRCGVGDGAEFLGSGDRSS